MTYNVGDSVLIVSHRTSYMNQNGLMDKYLNTVMTIRDVMGSSNMIYKMEEDRGEGMASDGWSWSDDEIVCKVVDENRLVKC